MCSYQRIHMIKIILATALTLGALQAQNIVHYDKKEATQSQTSKPNHPNDDLYPKK